MQRLRDLLQTYRDGGPFPTYKQLAEIAYDRNYDEQPSLRREQQKEQCHEQRT